MFFYASILFVLLLSVHCIILTYRKREKLTCMVGMMIAMTIGMMSSVVVGTILGILQRDLVSSLILSVIIGMLLGYWAGKPVSLMASIDGMLAGIMGGMMGAMLGVMVAKAYTIVMFVDVIFVFVLLILIQMIKQETGSKKINDPIGNGVFITIVIGISIVGVLFHFENSDNHLHNVTNQHSEVQKK